jgi:hypothetical protein
MYIGIAIKPDAGTRLPLVDIAASDGLLKAVDYFNFPDIQMLPGINIQKSNLKDCNLFELITSSFVKIEGIVFPLR